MIGGDCGGGEGVGGGRAEERLLAEAHEAHQNKQILNEFYNKTCTGAQTRILQLQNELYDQFSVSSFVDSVRHQGVHKIPLDVHVRRRRHHVHQQPRCMA